MNRLDTLLAAVAPLQRRYREVLGKCHDESRARALSAQLGSLALAQAYLESLKAPPDRPLQIAAIGPTQAGKSTVVNLLLGEDQAVVSPLAGYTVHPQGFPLNLDDSDWGWLDDFFRTYRRCRPDQLPEASYDAYGLASSVHQPDSALPACVVWDTPDFDSVDAADYQAGVLRAAALADVLLVVVSKDKYADQTVWETVSLLAPLAQQTVFCLNKTPSEVGATLARSLAEKWQVVRQDPVPQVVALPYLDPENAATLREMELGTARLRTEVARAARAVKRTDPEKLALQLLRQHWEQWLAPVRAEQRAHEEWRSLIAEALNEALALYTRDYLDQPRHYETFQRAMAELLVLLEIPGLAGILLNARKLVTWPVRQLTRLGSSRKNETDKEADILLHVVEHLYIRLGDGALDRSTDTHALENWWRELGKLLRETRSRGVVQAEREIAAYRLAFRPEIESTARELYERLSRHPAILNSLRATRVTTDAAALAVALHTGGLGIHDFILAPAILSLTSLLAESALGRYLHKAEADLKKRQLERVRRLFELHVRDPLTQLPQRLTGAERFNLAPEAINQAEQLLK
ncbi:GTPase domain-containing protein [Methylococcus sp. EFPC2]|uniref:GTPase domain-containing protein n=1 Tax=Methylococcus sp. EFPC2 TaxID=2812648 RepID=UPI00196735BB|nr:GTPase domain-containing protein [Methylococcus sp. EFPC2]QSA98800.1 50S ribosome-binding GTPase [Methylococcus sp. EFPC2]